MKNIVIVDDHELFRSGIKELLSEIDEFNLLEADNGKALLEMMQTINLDLVLMDIKMPGMDGIEATEKALAIQPDLNILVLSMYDDQKYYNTMIDLGVKGFVLKNTSLNELKNAVVNVMDGRSYFSQELLMKLLNKKQDEVNINFTAREKDVLQLIAKGASTQEISDELNISFRTVERHRANLLLKTDTNSSLKLLIFAIKHQLIDIT